MKTTTLSLITALILTAVIACGRGTHIKRSVSYQGNMMRVKVYAKVDGRQVHDYDKEFNVAGLSKAEREAMAQHIMDSLDLLDNTGK